MKKLLLLLIILGPAFCQGQTNEKIQSKSDIYFVVDKSQSMSTKANRRNVDKVLSNLCDKLLVEDQNLRMSLITFSEDSQNLLSLTNDKSLFYDELRKMFKVKNDSEKSFLYPALEKTEDQIIEKWNTEVNVGTVTPVTIVILTDGMYYDVPRSTMLLNTISITENIRIFTIYFPDNVEWTQTRFVETKSGKPVLSLQNHSDFVAELSLPTN